jgi:maleate isomerase
MKLEFDVDEGIGTRATMGVIVLATDETLEPEFSTMMDIEGVALYHSRIAMVPEVRPDTLAQMEADLPASAQLFPSSLDFDVIGYGCTSASTVIGSDNVARAIQTVFPDAKVSDPLAAIIAAGRALGAQRLGFITPYLPEVSLKMREALQTAGFEVAAFGSFKEGNDQIVARISEASIKAAAHK